LPILHGDRLAGNLDVAPDRKAGLLSVDAIHQDVPFGKTRSPPPYASQIRDLARWLELDVKLPA